MEENEEKLECIGCSDPLSEPYIKCIQCIPETVLLCLHCYARGLELGKHENNHSYIIMKNDFPLFEDNWTAAEEIELLNLMAELGFGNWSDIAQQLKTKTKLECERHYNKCYLENPHSSLPVFPEREISYHPAPVIFKLSEDPPRPPEGSGFFNDMAGYMAARGDFNIEYNNYIELDLKDTIFGEETEDNFLRELKFAVLDVYRDCLKERQRRRRIIRDYGLIDVKKNLHLIKRYEKTIRYFLDGLRVFTTLMPPIEFDKYLESLHCEWQMKNEIRCLQEYRTNGLTLLRQIKTFKRLKARRESMKTKFHLLSDVLSNIQNESACKTWLQRQAVLDHICKGQNATLPAAPRRAAPPLDIVGLPAYDKLSEKEKELCALVRLVPAAYLEFKKVLVTECEKNNGMKLAQARSLIKIDVNKTRKIYDFLLNEGHIYKDNMKNSS